MLGLRLDLDMLNSRSPPPIFPMNSDLTDRILTTLLDFQSLQAFISSSKSVYSVFRCRQGSILGAVARNQFGLVLPQAVRLAEYSDRNHISRVASELECETSFAQASKITPTQARLLRDHEAIVRTLEDIYSWREKDPRFKTSQLSPDESLRFQKSVYRFWLLAAMYGPGALINEKLECRGDNHLQLTDSVVTGQITFLLSLGEIDLLGVGEVHRFLLDLSKWALIKDPSRLARFGGGNDVFLVWSGPAVILDAFRGKWPPLRHTDLQWHEAWRAMTHTFSGSAIVSITGEELLLTRQRSILDDSFLETIDCSRCDGVPSLFRTGSLWSIYNWEYMLLVIAPSRLGSFLSFEKKRPLDLLVSFTEMIESISYSQCIDEIFDIRSERYKDWNKNDWLCTHCMTKLLSDNTQAWFDDRTTETDTTRFTSEPLGPTT